MARLSGAQGKLQVTTRLQTSRAAILKFRPVVWSTLFLGYARRCWAWDPGDPCQNLLVSSASGSSHRRQWLIPLEFIQCIRQDSTCQDVPGLCGGLDCDAEYDVKKFVASLYGVSFRNSESMLITVSAACPLTCHVCGPRKDERHVQPNVATILRGPCEHGWSYADGACFKYAYGGSDGASSLWNTWFDAEEACQAEGAHLATVVTKAHEHLVFNLVQQRPARLGTFGQWAWVGLWTGPMGCAHNSSNWTWTGNPQTTIGIGMPHASFLSFCNPEFAGRAHAMHTNSSFGFHSALTTSFRRAWICSKPALFHTVTGGLCQDSGLLPILDLGACEAAAAVLLGVNTYAFRPKRGATATFGCQVSEHGLHLHLNTEPASQNVSADQGVTQLCQSANATDDHAATDAVQRLEGTWEGVDAGNVSPSFSRPVVAVLLVAGFLPVFGFVAVQRQDLVALQRYVLLLVLSLHARVCKRETAVTDHSIAVAARLRQRRRRIASITAVAVAGFHLLELVRTCLVEESVCTRNGGFPQLRFLIALVHLGSLWVASLFLVLAHKLEWNSSHLDLAFLLFIVVLDIAQTALVGEQALLVESRLYSQLLWRLLLGACTPPVIALLGNLLYITGAGILYRVLIPDGLIFTVGSSRAGLLYNQGCNQLWSRHDALAGKELKLDVSRLRSFVDDSAVQNLKALLDELLSKQTSFQEFLLSEILLATIVMVCLICLNTILFQEISQSLRLQSSEDQRLAVSQIMDRLCDATCQLSRKYNICSCSSKLAAILRMSPTGQRSMEGQSFCDLIASKDERECFKAFIDQGIRDGFNDALYLELSSASSTRVRMQLLCAGFTDVRGRPRVLCGLNELQADGPSAAVPGAADACGPLPGPTGHRRPRGAPAGDTASDSGSDGSRSDSSRGSRCCEIEVILDEDLRIASVSRAFENFLGARLRHKRDASIKPFLADQEVFPELVKHCAESARTDELGGAPAPVVGIRFNTLVQEDGVMYSKPVKGACKVQLCEFPAAPSRATLQLVAAKGFAAAGKGQRQGIREGKGGGGKAKASL